MDEKTDANLFYGSQMIVLYIFALIQFSLSYIILLRQIKINRTVKIILTLLFLIISFKNPLLLIFGGNILAPQLPGWVVVGASSAQFCLMVVLCLGILSEIFYLFFKIACKYRVSNSHRVCVLCLDTLFAVVITCIGTYNAGLPPENIFYTFTDPKYPDNFRIVHITDTHIGTNTSPERIRNLVKQINDLHPDLIVHTGDIIDGRYEAIAPQVDELRGLKARYGVYAVNGNHEYYSDAASWNDVWGKLNIRMINNSNVTITDDSGKRLLFLTGISDPQALRVNPPEQGPDYVAATEGFDRSLPMVMLSHRPKEFPNCVTAGADITLSGHTHGGMVPGLKQLVALLNGGYVSGYYEHQGKKMILNNGTILWAGFYIRINDPAQVVVIDLKNR